MRMTRTSAAAIVAAAALMIGLSGCATPAENASEGTKADPGGDSATLVALAWMGQGTSVAIVTWGSSSCPPYASDVRGSDQRITVTVELSGESCTDDLAPRGFAVPPPAGIDVTQPVEVVLSGAVESRAELPGYSGDLASGPSFGTEPEAVWTSVPGVAALLTYGSSSCRPAVASIAGASDGVIEVQLVEPSAEQICTADLAPQITAIDTRGAENVDPATTTTIVFRQGDASFDVVIAPPG